MIHFFFLNAKWRYLKKVKPSEDRTTFNTKKEAFSVTANGA